MLHEYISTKGTTHQMCTPSANGGLDQDQHEPMVLGTRKRENLDDELYTPRRRALVRRECVVAVTNATKSSICGQTEP